jgi:hypothetical protein
MSHENTVRDFAKGKDRAVYSSNIFAENGVLYSYGKHFPLAIRQPEETNLSTGKEWYLLNGDKYSSSTSGHQSLTFRHLLHEPRVSFTAIEQAGFIPSKAILVDFTKDYQDYWSWRDSKNGVEELTNWKRKQPIGVMLSETHASVDNVIHGLKKGDLLSVSAHRVGSVVLQGGVQHYLCSMDENSYFVSLLPHRVASVEEAFSALKPSVVSLAEGLGKEVKRQGEWFFIKFEREELKSLGIKVKDFTRRGYLLPKEDVSSNDHIATRAFINDSGRMFVTGTIRHKNRWGGRGDHRTVKLGMEVYEAHVNTALRSWSSAGNVD